MDTQNQFAIFGICLCIGFVGGVLYEIFAPLRLAFGCAHGKNKIVGYTLDVVFWICFAVFTVINVIFFCTADGVPGKSNAVYARFCRNYGSFNGQGGGSFNILVGEFRPGIVDICGNDQLVFFAAFNTA